MPRPETVFTQYKARTMFVGGDRAWRRAGQTPPSLRGMNSEPMKRTALFAAHQKLGGKMIPFGGWEMPVQYTGIVDEHNAVRNAAGIFDISHMGEFRVKGSAAGEFLNTCLTNDIGKLAEGQGQYTLMCNERGGVVDDLYVYRLREHEFLLIVNASRIAADASWLQKQLRGFVRRDEVTFEDISENTGAVAMQGPRVVEFVDRCFPGQSRGGTPARKPSELKKNEIGQWTFGTASIWVSRTGYTGEDGFEVVAPAEAIGGIWDTVLQQGSPYGLKPAGLGARDTLRTEVCYPLYGHELDESTTPMEAGLGFFVALEKGEFVGRAVLARQKAEGTARKLIAFKMRERSAPPRPQYPIWAPGAGGKRLGEVVSGTQSPTLNAGIGMGYVPTESAKAQSPIEIEIRGKRTPAIVVPKPFYRKEKQS